MKKHGWQLPYHPLQVVAVAVFLALGFAYYVFFAPFVGKKLYQYIAMAMYTPLITCAVSLYIWCAAADPADPGVFRSKKYLKIAEKGKHGCNINGGKSLHKDGMVTNATSNEIGNKNASKQPLRCLLLAFSPCAYIGNCGSSEESRDEQMSEDGMFYCSLCEVEVFKYSKHCRVCDKCVHSFDHHCRWLNNCIGKRNYRQFFTLMISALLMVSRLILQWCTGILVLVCCAIERKRFAADISSKLGSSFSLAPFIIVVVMCTILAMIATLPLVQLFFFHILLIKKGISTYDYIIALREQEQEQQGVGGQQSSQMSPVNSLTGLSTASSFSTFHRGAWCTPPRLFLEDQFDVIPPDSGSVSSFGKKMAGEEPIKKKNPAVKISPWALARLNAEEISKAAAEARKKSKILQPMTRHHDTPFGLEVDNTFGSSSRRMVPRPDNNRRRTSKRVHLPDELSKVLAKSSDKGFSLAPLQLEARSAFHTSSGGIVDSSSPESSLESPDIHPFRISSSGDEELRPHAGVLHPAVLAVQKGFPFTRSTSDGYEASGGEDSDRVPSRIVQRSTNWSSILFADQNERVVKLKAPSSSNSRKL